MNYISLHLKICLFCLFIFRLSPVARRYFDVLRLIRHQQVATGGVAWRDLLKTEWKRWKNFEILSSVT